jgi:hypothetical protein
MAIRRDGCALMAAAMMLLTTACTGTKEDLRPAESQAQAVQRVEQLVQEAFAQLPPGATMKVNLNTDAMPCDDPTDGGPAGRIFAERRYFIVPPSTGTWPKAAEAVPALVGFWQEQGYKVRSDGRNDPEPRYMVETADGYRVTAATWNRGDHLDLSLGATSPCVWENGTPNPQ